MDSSLKKVKRLGRRRWKEEYGYHRRGTVENTIFRHGSMLGYRVHARDLRAQEIEAAIGCEVLNAMKALGRPRSVVAAP